MKHNRMLFFLLAVAVLPAVAAPAPGSNAERVLARLKEVADSPNYYWAWTHPWMNAWERKGDARFAVKTEKGFEPLPTDKVKLACGYSKYADGRLVAIGYSDLAAVAGTWHSQQYYAANRATLTAAIKRHWREYGGITVFSWHMDQPYCTNGFRQASYRFKSAGADRNVIRQILDGTGGPCGTDSIEGRNYRPPFPNPRAWYMAALKDIADFFNGLVDEETGEKIPVIMRYGHEMDGAWFWWGRTWCEPAEFRAFSRLTADYLRAACGEGQILFAYTVDRTWHDFGKEGDTRDGRQEQARRLLGPPARHHDGGRRPVRVRRHVGRLLRHDSRHAGVRAGRDRVRSPSGSADGGSRDRFQETCAEMSPATAAKMAAPHTGGAQLVAPEMTVAINCDPPG